MESGAVHDLVDVGLPVGEVVYEKGSRIWKVFPKAEGDVRVGQHDSIGHSQAGIRSRRLRHAEEHPVVDKRLLHADRAPNRQWRVGDYNGRAGDCRVSLPVLRGLARRAR